MSLITDMKIADRLTIYFGSLSLALGLLSTNATAQDAEPEALETTVVEAAEPQSRPVVRETPAPRPAPVSPAPEPETVESVEVPSLVLRDEAPVALKIDAPISETPRSVSVVTQQQFQDRGALTVQDALSYTAGVTAGPYGFDTRGDWGLIRGVAPVAYTNGLRSLFGYYNNTRPHPYALESVEIIKGPASVLYGQGSVGGIVNATFKTADTFERNEVYASYGSYDRFESGIDFGGRDGDISWRLVAVNREANSQVDYVPDDTWFILPSITWSPSEDTSLTLLYNYQEAETGTSAQFLPWQGTLLPGPSIPSNRFASEPGLDRYDTRQNSFTGIFEHRFNDVLSLEARANYTTGHADYRSMWPIFTGSGLNRILPGGFVPRTLYLSDAESEAFVTDVRLRFEFDTGLIAHNASVGLDFQDATTDNDSFYGLGTPLNLYQPIYGAPQVTGPLFDSPSVHLEQTGVYFNDRMEIGDSLIFNLGGRYDTVETSTQGGGASQKDSAFTGETGVMYRFDNGVAPYFSYAESFLPAESYQVDINGNILDPRQGSQYEVGVKYQPEGTNDLYTFAFFDITENNRAVSGPVPFTYEANGEVNISGVELEAAHQAGDFFFQSGYTYLSTANRDVPGDLMLESVPAQQAFGWVTWRPSAGALQGFKAGLGLRFVGDSYDATNTLQTPEYMLVDAMAGYEWGAWDLTLNVTNLADEEYVATALSRGDVFYGQRRYVALTLRREF